MFEDTLSFSVGGIRLYGYGLALMLGCWLGVAMLLFLSRKTQRERWAAALTAALSLPLGLLFARLVYCFIDPGFRPFISLKNVLDLSTGGLSMYGALLGAVVAALVSARIARVKSARMLDLSAPALAAFLISARLGEAFTSLGISRPLTTGWLAGSFLATRGDYDAYLRTWLLEAIAALVILLLLLRRLKAAGRDGRVFTLACLLYAVTQTLFESLRNDGHLSYGFIKVHQVASAVLLAGVLVFLSVRLLKNHREKKFLPVLTLSLLPLVLGGLIGVEFMLDRSTLGKLISYAAFLAVLAIPLTLGLMLYRQEAGVGQGTD